MSGIGRYVACLIEQIAADDDLYTLIDYDHRIPIEGLPANCRILESGIRPYSIKEMLSGISFFKNLSRQVDAILFTSFNIPLVIPKNSFLTLHDVILLKKDSGASLLKRVYLRNLLKSNCKRLRRLITISEASREDIAKELDLMHDSMDVVYHNVPVIHQKQGTETAHTDHGKYFLYVGNRKKHKNLRFLIEVFDQVCDAHPGFSLILVGSRFQKQDEVDAALASMKHPENVIDLEFVTDDELVSLYRNAYCCVLLSRYEGFGYIPLEAGMYGIPTIVSDRFSLPEIVDNPDVVADVSSQERTVALFERMISDEDFHRAAAEAAVERTEFFSEYPELEMTCRIIEEHA